MLLALFSNSLVMHMVLEHIRADSNVTLVLTKHQFILFIHGYTLSDIQPTLYGTLHKMRYLIPLTIVYMFQTQIHDMFAMQLHIIVISSGK